MISSIIYSCLLSLLIGNTRFRSVANNQLAQHTILTITHYKSPCMGEHVQWCFLITIDGGEQQYYYGQVEGLNYEWGFRYTISAEKIKSTNAAADAPSFTYQLKKIIKKERMPQTAIFSLPLQINDEA